VIEYLLSHVSSRGLLYTSLCEKLAQQRKNEGNKAVVDREWLSGQVKRLIWHYSSGINRRRSLLFEVEKKEEEEENDMEDSVSKTVWDHVLKIPFDNFTKKFVRDRLS